MGNSFSRREYARSSCSNTENDMNGQYEFEGNMISRIYLLSKTGSHVDVLIVTWCL